MIAILAEGIVISRAALKTLTPKTKGERTFCPQSVSSFAWPILDFVTVDRCPSPLLPSSPRALKCERSWLCESDAGAETNVCSGPLLSVSLCIASPKWCIQHLPPLRSPLRQAF